MRVIKWVAASLVLIVIWGGAMIFGALEGWYRSPIAPVGDADSFMESAVTYLQKDEPASIAFVLLEDGHISGSYFSKGIDADTLFPVASMSKWFTACGVMSLVEAGKIDLDAPVSTYLHRWNLPASEFNNDLVTTRLLLSHTAGLTDGLGFGDYTEDETLPALEESLSHPRASSGKPAVIRVGRQPGTQWQYSGGGYLVLQLLVEEVSAMPFEEYMRRTIFEPLGMTRSTYAYLGDQQNAAPLLTEDGELAPFYKYAAASATGLATTAHDLTLFLQAQVPQAGAMRLLPGPRLEQMRAPEASMSGMPIWGLGTMLFARTGGGNFAFGHGGQNDPAIDAEARLNPETGDGIIVLVTGNSSLATRLGFQWTFWQTGRPDFIGVGAEIQRMMPWFGIGAFIILIGACFGYWRTGRTRPREQNQLSS